MTGEQVFILQDGSLLGRWIETLLTQAEGLRLVGAASTRGDARQEIAAFNPDVIVIVGQLSGRNARAILDAMQNRPSSKVVTIGPGAERVLLHRSEAIAGSRPQDLIAAILSAPPKPQAEHQVTQAPDGNPRGCSGKVEARVARENLCSASGAGRETGGALRGALMRAVTRHLLFIGVSMLLAASLARGAPAGDGGRLLAAAQPAAAGQAIGAALAGPPPDATYVGSQVCQGCHQEQFAAFAETLMGKIFLKNARSPLERQGCEACHGPGSRHLEDVANPANNIRFGPKSVQSVTEQNAVCLQCHQKGRRLFWQGSPHASRDVSCVTCHSVMSPKPARAQLKAPDQLTLCKQCHPVFVAQQMNWSHMPVREGKLQCTSCHNPHGTITEKLIAENSVNELCYRCHMDKRGPFLWEHPPARESCLNCHKPHGSNNIRLLKIREPRLCQQCHNEGGHPRTAFAGGTTDPGQDRRFLGRSCALCHTMIHGSNHPRGFMFQR